MRSPLLRGVATDGLSGGATRGRRADGGALAILRPLFPAKGLAKLGIGNLSFLSDLRSFRYSRHMPLPALPCEGFHSLITVLNKYMFTRKLSIGDHADARQRHGERSHHRCAQIVAVAERARC